MLYIRSHLFVKGCWVNIDIDLVGGGAWHGTAFCFVKSTVLRKVATGVARTVYMAKSSRPDRNYRLSLRLLLIGKVE